jgi:hypothetical protein
MLEKSAVQIKASQSIDKQSNYKTQQSPQKERVDMGKQLQRQKLVQNIRQSINNAQSRVSLPKTNSIDFSLGKKKVFQNLLKIH